MRYAFIFVITLAFGVPAFAHGYKQRQFAVQQQVYAQPVMVQQAPVVYAQPQIQVQRTVIQKQIYVQPQLQFQNDYCAPGASFAPPLATPYGQAQFAPVAAFQDAGYGGGGGLTIQQQGGRRQNVNIGGSQGSQRRGLFGRRR